MPNSKLRRQIARLAAQLMYDRSESEYYTAKRKAASRLGLNFRYNPQELPANREIREEVQALARMYEGDQRNDDLLEMRLTGLRIMRLLKSFEPRMIGSVLTGHVRKGSDIDIHLFTDSVSAVGETLDRFGFEHVVERKRIIKQAEERIFTHIHLHDRFDIELTVYPRDKVGYRFKSSITGKSIERASIPVLIAMIREKHPQVDVPDDEPEAIDRYLLWSALLKPLEDVKQNPQWHPEGDALYHSLQAFEIARNDCGYDAELITAALLHDVGKAIDRHDHVATGLDALDGTLTERESFLIAHHMDAQAYIQQTLGHRAKCRLAASPWFDDLMTLRDIDNRARRRGAEVCTIDEAIEYLRNLNSSEDWDC
ncbi:MAG: tRNA adenylyltransferase [Phycisphaerae bacterium]|nr:MAG: tRNA adenylyltransferase [Phycisphaerae bacterium]